MQYLVVIEQSEHGYRAYAPDLPDCVALADTEAEVLHLIDESIHLHLEMMREEGVSIPEPTVRSAYVEVRS